MTLEQLRPILRHQNTPSAVLTVLGVLGGAWSAAALVEATGKPRRSVYEALEDFGRSGLVRKVAPTSAESRTPAYTLSAESRTQECGKSHSASAESRTSAENRTLENRVQDIIPTDSAESRTPGPSLSSFKSFKEEELKEERLKRDVVSAEKLDATSEGSAVDVKPTSPAAPPATAGKLRPVPKPKPQVSDEDCRRVLEAYNAHRGTLPAAESLGGSRRTAIARAVKEHGLEVCLRLVADAAAQVASERWWIENKYGLENLLRHLEVKAEAWRSRRPEPTRGNAVEDWLKPSNLLSQSDKEREKVWA